MSYQGTYSQRGGGYNPGEVVVAVGKSYKTRSGDKVEIRAADSGKKYPYEGTVWFGNSRKSGFYWNGWGGFTTEESSLDLVGPWKLSEDEMANKLKTILCNAQDADEKLTAVRAALEEFDECDC